MDPYFVNKSVLVTGAARGIGKTISKKLFKLGATVYALDVNEDGLNSLVVECPSVFPVVVDIIDWEATKNAVEKIEHLDMVVNNAGILPSHTSFLEVCKSEFDKVLSVNLMAAINISQVAGKIMMESGKPGAIVNVSSIAAFISIQKISPYCIAKAGLNMATKCMAMELAPNVRVNAVNPSGTLTEMAKVHLEQLDKAEKGTCTGQQEHTKKPMRQVLGRLAETDEIANAVVFLLSDKSSYMTGHCMPVDGGFLCT